MENKSPDLVLDNRFHAPPAFVKAWLTDFRADDGRFFGDATPFKVEREGHVIRRSQANPMGTMAMTVDVQREDRWAVDGAQRDPSGNVLFSFRILESVKPAPEGTAHRVEMFLWPSVALAPMLPQMIEQWRSTLKGGFAVMADEIATAARAGKAPLA